MGWVKRTTFDLPIPLIIETLFQFVLLISIPVQLAFAFTLLYFITRWKSRKREEYFPVSVIICARNESERLRRNLPLILDQEYNRFEVLVYDHGSTDDTALIIAELQSDEERLRYVKASDEVAAKPGKKHALKEALALATYDFVLLTDADCKPRGTKWIRRMAGQIAGTKSIVLGIGAYEDKPVWWNGLLQFETFLTAFQYMGFALAGKPYMGVGRNLAYDRREAIEYDFDRHGSLLSGDDDLLIQDVANVHNTAVCLSRASQTISEAPNGFLEWVRQKERHASAGLKYKTDVKVALALFKLSAYLFYPAFIFGIICGENLLLYSVLFLFRWMMLSSIYHRAGKKLSMTASFYFIPWFEIFFTVFDLWLLMKNLMHRPTRWK